MSKIWIYPNSKDELFVFEAESKEKAIEKICNKFIDIIFPLDHEKLKEVDLSVGLCIHIEHDGRYEDSFYSAILASYQIEN